MSDHFPDNQARLEEIAEADDVYLLWRRGYLKSAEGFAAFADSQPDEIRDLLWAYAESGRLMWQRMVNLACLHMRFPEEDCPISQNSQLFS